ncbi:hypothetical protein pah_c188o037 [Parachlamydia acanthamoebae str. Hall's coccus]|nr:hypothetical protein pah_c188o037 [Parachlamydia acanthamoebae str. Hall's coccus]
MLLTIDKTEHDLLITRCFTKVANILGNTDKRLFHNILLLFCNILL